MHEFSYDRGQSLGEVLALFREHGERARPLAGGTDLLIMMRAKRRQPNVVVDVKSVPEINTLALDATGLYVGAAVSCRTVYRRSETKAYFALLDSARLIGGVQIQGRASIGGNLCNAAPSGDSIPSLIALGAVAKIAGQNGKTREVPVEAFCVAPGKTILQPEEILVGIQIPAIARYSGSAYLRFTPRNEMDIAVAGVGASVTLNPEQNHFTSARIALASVGPTPIFATQASAFLSDKSIDEKTIHEAAKLAMDAAKPIDDMRGTARQRKHLVGVLTKRALHVAIERARVSS